MEGTAGDVDDDVITCTNPNGNSLRGAGDDKKPVTGKQATHRVSLILVDVNDLLLEEPFKVGRDAIGGRSGMNS